MRLSDTSPPSGTVFGTSFRKFWAAQTLSQFGTRVAEFAMPVVAVQLLGADSAQLGLLAAAETAAFLLLGLPAGAWVDRWRKRRVLLVAALVRAIAVALVPFLWFTEALTMTWLCGIVSVVGFTTLFFGVAYQSYVPFLVRDSEIGRANSRLETSNQLATSLAPSAGGLVSRVVGPATLLVADVVSSLTCIILLARIRDDETPKATATAELGMGLKHEIAEGLRFVASQPVIRRLVLAMSVSGMLNVAVATLVPLLVLRDLGLGASALGLVMTAGSVGGVLGAAITPRLRRVVPGGTLITVGLLTAASFLVLVPIAAVVGTRSPSTALALLIVSEFGLMTSALVFNVTQVTLRQALCPRSLLGRMNATVRFLVWGTIPLGALIGGALGAQLGLTTMMWVAAVGSLIFVLPVVGLGKLIPRDLEW